MTQLGFSALLSKLHWRALILTLALLVVANFVFFDGSLREAFSTQQGQQSLTDPNTSIEVEDWEPDPLLMLGKAGIQELGPPPARTLLESKSTVVAAPTDPSGDKSRI